MRIFVVLEYSWRDGELTEVTAVQAFDNAGEAQVCKAGGKFRHIEVCDLVTKEKGKGNGAEV